MKYLLDTCICIHLMQNKFGIKEKIKSVGINNCCISEITQIELLYGVFCSSKPKENEEMVNKFLKLFDIIPISSAIKEFSKQKCILRKEGLLIEDFDLLISTSAISNNCVLVTENVKHCARLTNIRIENWVNRKK